MNVKAPTMRLDRLLANLGYGSRREIDIIAGDDDILLDGAPVADVTRRIALTPDLSARMTVRGAPLDPLPGLVIMLNKPRGVTCSHKEASPLVYDLLPERWRRRDPKISTIGRLDKETSGLLLLTDDGLLLHKVIAPKSHIGKRYLAELARPLRADTVEIFASGTLMLESEEKPLLPAALEVISPTCARVTLHEGRYHQVRRMFAAIGNHVERLHRETIGGLSLPEDLSPGAFRILSPNEIEMIFN